MLDGLEVRVAFGNVWKESLSELSGGQRYHISEKRPYLSLNLISHSCLIFLKFCQPWICAVARFYFQ